MISIKVIFLTLTAFISSIFGIHSQVVKKPVIHSMVSPSPTSIPSPTASASNAADANAGAALTPTEKVNKGDEGNKGNAQTNSGVSGFVYPGSTSQGGGNYTSTDSTDMITSWYENAYTNNGFHGKSEAKTNTNGNIFNKFSASNGSKSISVTIQKNAGNSVTTISITSAQSNNSSVQININNTY